MFFQLIISLSRYLHSQNIMFYQIKQINGSKLQLNPLTLNRPCLSWSVDMEFGIADTLFWRDVLCTTGIIPMTKKPRYGNINRKISTLNQSFLSRLKTILTSQEAEGSIALSISYQSVRPVQRDLCARPFTFELVSNLPQQQDDNGDNAFAK